MYAVVSSPAATEEIGAMGREIESRLKKKNVYRGFFQLKKHRYGLF
jgi:hypothetical protein